MVFFLDLAMLWERKTDIAYYIASAAQDTIVELGLIVAGILAVYQIFAMLM